jgi:hypothetical protein
MITQFWLNDPSILFKNKHILELWPTLAMSKEEKLNAITRIIIILSALGYIITGSNNFIIIFVIMSAIILLFYNLTKSQIVRETFTNQHFSNERLETPYKPEMRSEIYEKMTPSIKNPLMNVLSSEYSTNPNRPPALDYDNSVEPKINEAVKGAIKKNLNNDKSFPDLFKDLGDKLDFDQSMRNFNITPNTQIPNDQDKFLNFLYGNLPSEKNVNVH